MASYPFLKIKKRAIHKEGIGLGFVELQKETILEKGDVHEKSDDVSLMPLCLGCMREWSEQHQ